MNFGCELLGQVTPRVGYWIRELIRDLNRESGTDLLANYLFWWIRKPNFPTKFSLKITQPQTPLKCSSMKYANICLFNVKCEHNTFNVFVYFMGKIQLHIEICQRINKLPQKNHLPQFKKPCYCYKITTRLQVKPLFKSLFQFPTSRIMK